MTFPPILIILFIWIFIGLPLAKLNQAAKKQQAAKHARPAGKASRPAAAGPAEPAEPAEPSAPRVLEPSIRFSEHDDSVYRGSLNAVTGEGYDPCHEEQLSSLSSAETAVPSEPAPVPGLQLSWTGSDVVRGIVMSEILKRK